MIDFHQRIAATLVGGLTRICSSLPPQWVLLIHALAIAVVVVVVYGLVSNQARIRRRKSRMLARLLEIRIFQSDPLAVFGAFGRMLFEVGAYIAASLTPLIVLLPIMVLWISQLAMWFEWRPLRPGETSIVTVALKQGVSPIGQPAKLETPDAFAVETPAFRSLATNEVSWRVKATQPGEGEMRCAAAGYGTDKNIAAAKGLAEVSPRRAGSDFWTRVLWPAEAALPADAPFSEIRVDYPQRTLRFFGWEMNWLVALLIASIVLALVVKKPFRVEF